jgi:hypothetical protein
MKRRRSKDELRAIHAKGFRIRASENLRKQSVPTLPEYLTKYPSYDAAYLAGISRWGSADLDARMGWFISEDGGVQPLDKKPRQGKRTSARPMGSVDVVFSQPLGKRGLWDYVVVSRKGRKKRNEGTVELADFGDHYKVVIWRNHKDKRTEKLCDGTELNRVSNVLMWESQPLNKEKAEELIETIIGYGDDPVRLVKRDLW